MQQKKPMHLGVLFSEDSPSERIPIYGVDEVSLESRANWDVNTVGVQGPVIAIWQGDNVRGYNFNFELFAGVEGAEIFPNTRQDLVDYMKWIHSWNAHDGEPGAVSSPAAVRLVLGEFINQRGIIKNTRTTAKAPWGGLTFDPSTFEPELDNGQPTSVINAMAPTSCLFSGEFLFLPGYDQKTGAINVKVETKRLNRQSIRSSFFRG